MGEFCVGTLTKRLVVIEILLVILLGSRILLGSLGSKLNAARVKECAARLERIPDTIAGWEWDRTVTDKNASIELVAGGGWNLFVRSYVRPDTGDRLYFQVVRWLDPINCYEMHGWQVFKAAETFLAGQGGRALRAAGIKEAWVEKQEQKMALLFWESDLLNPSQVQESALTEKTDAKGRLSRLWRRTLRRVKSFFRKSNIVAKVIYEGELSGGDTRDAVLEFTRDLHEILPGVLK
jgi:hypothetical protein